MRPILLALSLLLAWFAPLMSHAADGWRVALPGWKYEYPRDHWSHREFKTEWWYFTGELRTGNGRRFGYQATFFRQGIRPPNLRRGETSRFIVNDFPFAHMALTDLSAGKFRYTQKHSRGAFGEAGFGDPGNPEGRVAWIDQWRLTIDSKGNYAVHATMEGVELTLHYESAKPWVSHGRDGISRKAAGEGHASHYYSGTRLQTGGTLKLDGETLEVTGESWFDHEWATNVLTPEQLGWNWLSLQFDDGTELMLFQLRLRNGGLDPHSSGTFVDGVGRPSELSRDDVQLEPLRYWESPQTKARYPVAWRLTVPKLDIQAEVVTPLPSQELVLSPIAYWEGLVDVSGNRTGKPLKGHGYMEMTGYAGAVVGLSTDATAESSAPSGR